MNLLYRRSETTFQEAHSHDMVTGAAVLHYIDRYVLSVLAGSNGSLFRERNFLNGAETTA